jgi:tetratricopeptide (TPR) repeat protein
MGLRRGRSLLKRQAPAAAPVLSQPARLQGARLLAAACALPLLLAASGCSGPSGLDKDRFELFRDNSRNFYDRGSYPQALHQAKMALALQPDDEGALLIEGFCLVKIGNVSNNPLLLDEALKIFEALLDTSEGAEDFRVSMGLGSACLARSFEHDREIARISKRLGSEYLSGGARDEDRAILEQEKSARTARLAEGEKALRNVLAQPLQKDNPFPIVDLVLTLNAEGGHDEESLALAKRALVELDASTLIKQNQITKNAKISASAKVDLEQQIADSREKEVMLRDLVATVHYNNGDTDGFFEQMSILEERKLMGEVQYYNRANVHEKLGHFAAAADDLDHFMRLRVQHMSYDQDDMASQTFQRIETLRAQAANVAQTPR